MQLIRADQKDTENLSFAKARVADEEQDQAESEEIVETTKRNPSGQEASKEIHVQTLQAFGQI